MKILVCSDSHGNYSSLNEIYLHNFDVNNFIHLGDSELPEYLLNNFCAIKGNCDYNDLPRVKDIVIGDLKIHLEHGDGYLFNFDKERYVLSLHCDIFLFGHTHKKLATKIGNTYIFNPGSLTKPRDGDRGSYLILEIENKQLKGYKFIDAETYEEI